MLCHLCVSGKTTVGSVLAKNLNYMFMDSDSLIEKAVKCSIEEIFELNGEEEFRKLETSVCLMLDDKSVMKTVCAGASRSPPVQEVDCRHGRRNCDSAGELELPIPRRCCLSQWPT